MNLSDENDDDDLAIAFMIYSINKRNNALIQRKKRNRQIWTRSWIGCRLNHGAYYALIQELRLSDVEAYRNFLRMDSVSFDILLRKVGPRIGKQDTRMRLSIPAEERLALTLRWLATGKPI